MSILGTMGHGGENESPGRELVSVLLCKLIWGSSPDLLFRPSASHPISPTSHAISARLSFRLSVYNVIKEVNFVLNLTDVSRLHQGSPIPANLVPIHGILGFVAISANGSDPFRLPRLQLVALNSRETWFSKLLMQTLV